MREEIIGGIATATFIPSSMFSIPRLIDMFYNMECKAVLHGL